MTTTIYCPLNDPFLPPRIVEGRPLPEPVVALMWELDRRLVKLSTRELRRHFREATCPYAALRPRDRPIFYFVAQDVWRHYVIRHRVYEEWEKMVRWSNRRLVGVVQAAFDHQQIQCPLAVYSLITTALEKLKP